MEVWGRGIAPAQCNPLFAVSGPLSQRASPQLEETDVEAEVTADFENLRPEAASKIRSEYYKNDIAYLPPALVTKKALE